MTSRLPFILVPLAALVLAPFAPAQPSGSSACTPPDEITIRDDGIGKAIVTYSNSVNQCSVPLIRRLVSPQGIAVDVRIDLLGDEHERRERITLNPVDADMMAFPPEGDLLDGESREFVIMGGLA
jgi:hypothetical protein